MPINFLISLNQSVFNSMLNNHTHTQGRTLDLVISRRSDNIIEDLPRVDRFLSDHGTVLFSLKSIKPSLSPTESLNLST